MKTLGDLKKDNYGQNNSFYTYIIEGDPIPLARARHGVGRTWDPQKHQKYIIGLQLQSQHPLKRLFVGPIHLDICFFLPMAKRSKKEIINTFHFFKPDLSNLIKFIEDIGSGILYKDDCLIASMSATKKYSDNPRTKFTISELKPYE
jgi:Holliday junction resolvase RusA-like endonuclease